MRLLIHIPVGAFNAWLLHDATMTGIIFSLGFMVYELNEDWRIKDQAWKDLAGWLWGFALAAALLALL